MKKTSFAAIAFAAAAFASGACLAQESVLMMPMEFSVSTNFITLDKDKNVLLDKDGAPVIDTSKKYTPKKREASACILDQAGKKYMLKADYHLLGNLNDLKIRFFPEIDLNVLAVNIIEKFPPEKADKAGAYVNKAFRQVIGRHALEEIQTEPPSDSFQEDMEATFAKVAKGERLSQDEPSFKEETGIAIKSGGFEFSISKGCAL